jgi:hypothetical protein
MPTAASLARLTVGVVALALLAGCGTGTRPSPSFSAPSVVVPVAPHGSATVGCELSRPVNGGVQDEDLLIGPLDIPTSKDGYAVTNFPQPVDGVSFFKVGMELPADASVTLSIGEEARAYAGIITEKGQDEGYSSVSYRACSATEQDGMVFWVGGFTLVGRASACVPLEVQVKGETAIRHTDFAIPVGACD